MECWFPSLIYVHSVTAKSIHSCYRYIHFSNVTNVFLSKEFSLRGELDTRLSAAYQNDNSML